MKTISTNYLKRKGLFIKGIGTLIYIASFVGSAYGQGGTTSIISSQGLGDVNSGSFSAGQAMSGAGVDVALPNRINFVNPASYANFKNTVFETGIRSNTRKAIESGTAKINSSASPTCLALGFPVHTHWGMSLGVLPFTSSGYNVYSNTTDSVLGNIKRTYNSNGGVSQVYLGNGFRLTPHVTLGVNAAWLFGTIQKTSTIEYLDLTKTYYSRLTYNNAYSGLYPGLGIQILSNTLKTKASDSIVMYTSRMQEQHDKFRAIPDSLVASKDSAKAERDMLQSVYDNISERRVKGPWKLGVGLVFNPPMTASSKNNILSERYKYVGGYATVSDTTYDVTKRIDVKMPMKVGVGLSYTNEKSWLLTLEAMYADWTGFNTGTPDKSLSSGYRFVFGFEHTSSNVRSKKGFFHKLHYRGGLYFEKSFFELDGNALYDYGASLGVGMPFRKSMSELNLSAGVGTRMFAKNISYSEQYLNLTLGLVISDKWFVRKKFD